MKRKRWIPLAIIVMALLLMSALAVSYHFQQVKLAGEQPMVIDEEQKKTEWTKLNDERIYNRLMANAVTISFGPGEGVFGGDKGYYVELEHIQDLRPVDITIAAFRMEPMQIEELYLECQIYKVEQEDEEVLVYRQYIPFPSNSLEPHIFYRYKFDVDYWEQDIFEKGQQFIVRLKHSDNCTYYLAEMDFHGEIWWILMPFVLMNIR